MTFNSKGRKLRDSRHRKFQNADMPGRINYNGEPKLRQKVIWSRKYRQVRRHKNEISFQSRKRNRRR